MCIVKYLNVHCKTFPKRTSLSINNTNTNAILYKIERGKNKSNQLYSNSIKKIENTSQYNKKLFKID